MHMRYSLYEKWKKNLYKLSRMFIYYTQTVEIYFSIKGVFSQWFMMTIRIWFSCFIRFWISLSCIKAFFMGVFFFCRLRWCISFTRRLLRTIFTISLHIYGKCQIKKLCMTEATGLYSIICIIRILMRHNQKKKKRGE